MLAIRDNLAECFSALRAHKLRASLTMLGLTMGVATLITVMTIVQGANVYVEQKIANLGTNVFQIARTPFAVTDFNIIIKALKYRKIELEDMQAIAESCTLCQEVGATASVSGVRVRYANKEVTDVSLSGQTPSMADIDTRTVDRGRYFTASEGEHRTNVCLIGDTLVQQLFLGVDPLGKTLRVGNEEFIVIGVMEKVGSVLGQDQDNYVMIPLSAYLKMQGAHSSVTINVKASTQRFQDAQDQAQLILRARRHLTAHTENDFFIGHQGKLHGPVAQHQHGIFRRLHHGERNLGHYRWDCDHERHADECDGTAERDWCTQGRRSDETRYHAPVHYRECCAVPRGRTNRDLAGIPGCPGLAFVHPFPASVQKSVAVLGMFLSSAVGLFFGIYPRCVPQILIPSLP
jgi:hypothetical protein